MANVLIIDDDDLMVSSLELMVRRLGHKAASAGSLRAESTSPPRGNSTLSFWMSGCRTGTAWTFCPASLKLRPPPR
jgi:hypothetical protein